MYEGRIVGAMDAADADVGQIGLLMTGGTPGSLAPEPAAIGPAGRAPRPDARWRRSARP